MPEFELGGREIESPFGNAAGVVKTPEDFEIMLNTGVGFVTLGSITKEYRPGNSPNGEKVYDHNPLTGETFNSLGMPNPGMEQTEQHLPTMLSMAADLGKVAIINIAGVSDKPVIEYAELTERAAIKGAKLIELNFGCPNVVTPDGGRHEILSYHPDVVYETVQEVWTRINGDVKIAVKLSPLTEEAIKQYAAIGDYVDIISTPNTIPNQHPLNEKGEDLIKVPGGLAGLSGPITAPMARQQLQGFVELFGGEKEIISNSGVKDGSEAAERLRLGASAVGAVTFFYESHNWKKDVDKFHKELAEAA